MQKEQADGDYQNLVCSVMVEGNIGLQDAMDVVTAMLDDRILDYKRLKSRLPSYGAAIDKELARFLCGVEQFVQGTVEWYYSFRQCSQRNII